MDDFRFYVRHELPGDPTPEYRGAPYHSEEMAMGAYQSAVAMWGEDYNVELLDSDGNVILSHKRPGLAVTAREIV